VAKNPQLLTAVKDILFREWNPIGVNSFAPDNEYDSYTPTVVNLLLSGADEYKLASRLSEFQRVSMGMTVIDEELHRRVARRLIGLHTES